MGHFSFAANRPFRPQIVLDCLDGVKAKCCDNDLRDVLARGVGHWVKALTASHRNRTIELSQDGKIG